MKNNIKVFLGGTLNDSTWRDKLIPLLEDNGINYFNPVVDDWNKEAQLNEIKERSNCDFCLYTITPKMIGCYSIAEAIDDSNKRPGKTILCILSEDDGYLFNTNMIKSLNRVRSMVENNGGHTATCLQHIVRIILGE